MGFRLRDVEAPDEVDQTVAFPWEDGLCERECVERLVLQGRETVSGEFRLNHREVKSSDVVSEQDIVADERGE